MENPIPGALKLSPGSINLVLGDGVRFVPLREATAISPSQCIWQAANTTTLSSKGSGEFVGKSIGSSSVTASCNGTNASASVVVSSAENPTAIRITSGGTYSGSWTSSDPKIPAVTILTNEPVVVRNSKLAGRGDLIVIYGSKGGANVVIDNVTGTALDPGVEGQPRGKFIDAQTVSQLSVTHCTMHGGSFGVYVAASTLESLRIRDNAAFDLNDQKSDGQGGFIPNQRVLGHFIMFNGVKMPNGGEIAWNQMSNLDETGSVEDIISFFQSHGSAEKAVLVHDNYLQGALARGQTTPYTGGGIQMDGSSDDASTATGFIRISGNTIVHLAGFGISIGAGHDISVVDNRIVSCGKDSNGKWIAGQGTVALGMWNYYRTNQYYNNYIGNNSGGLVKPDTNNNPSPGNIYAPSASASLNNVIGTNHFEQPCLTAAGTAAETVEKKRWLDSAALAGELLGDQH